MYWIYEVAPLFKCKIRFLLPLSNYSKFNGLSPFTKYEIFLVRPTSFLLSLCSHFRLSDQFTETVSRSDLYSLGPDTTSVTSTTLDPEILDEPFTSCIMNVYLRLHSLFSFYWESRKGIPSPSRWMFLFLLSPFVRPHPRPPLVFKSNFLQFKLRDLPVETIRRPISLDSESVLQLQPLQSNPQTPG